MLHLLALAICSTSGNPSRGAVRVQGCKTELDERQFLQHSHCLIDADMPLVDIVQQVTDNTFVHTQITTWLKEMKSLRAWGTLANHTTASRRKSGEQPPKWNTS